MPIRYYVIEIVQGCEIHVFFETFRGLLVRYVVKLVLKQPDGYHEVIRFDTAHDCPHKDILGTDGKVQRKVWFETLDNQQGLDMAIKDLKDNSEMYIERFLQWQKKLSWPRKRKLSGCSSEKVSGKFPGENYVWSHIVPYYSHLIVLRIQLLILL